MQHEFRLTKEDKRPTYVEYRAAIKIGGTTTMSDAQRKKARLKRKKRK